MAIIKHFGEYNYIIHCIHFMIKLPAVKCNMLDGYSLDPYKAELFVYTSWRPKVVFPFVGGGPRV